MASRFPLLCQHALAPGPIGGAGHDAVPQAQTEDFCATHLAMNCASAFEHF